MKSEGVLFNIPLLVSIACVQFNIYKGSSWSDTDVLLCFHGYHASGQLVAEENYIR